MNSKYLFQISCFILYWAPAAESWKVYIGYVKQLMISISHWVLFWVKQVKMRFFLLLLLFFSCSYCWKSWLLNSGCYNRISWFVFFPESPGIGFSLTACSWSFHSAWGHRGGQTCAAINLLFMGGDVFSPAKATWLKIAWPLPCAAIWSKMLVILYAHVLLFCTTEEMGLNKAKPLLWGRLM